MSAISPTTEPRRQPRATRAFERRVWTNPEICNECFERIKRVTERPMKWDREVEEHHRTEEASLGHAELAEGVFRGRTFCDCCGGRGHCLDQDHSLEEMVDRVPTLATRMIEEGVAVDVDDLFTFVRRFKSVDGLQGEDRELYEAAVWFAVERSRGLLQSKMALQQRIRSGDQLPDLLDPDDP